MRNFFSLIALLSFSVFAQDAEEYKYEVEGNKAEYYIGTFKKGKGINDLAAWYEKFNEWTQTKGNLFDQMSVAILTPYFSSELSSIWDFKFSFFEKPLYWIYFVGHIPTMIFIPLLIPTCLMVQKLIKTNQHC